MTYAEFLVREWENPHVEWVSGKVVAMSPITNEHNAVGNFLLHVTDIFVQVNDLGVVRSEPFQMKAGPKLPGRAPDILFVSNKNLARLKKTFVDGPADVVVEVISPGSRGVDRGDKFYEYEKGGVREYWLIDPERKKAEFYLRGRDGSYELAKVEDGIFKSSILKDLWIRVDWLWKKPAPPLLEALKELDLR